MFCNFLKSLGQHLLFPDLSYAAPTVLAMSTQSVRIPDALLLYLLTLAHPLIYFLPSRIYLSFHAFCELFLKDSEIVGKSG